MCYWILNLSSDQGTKRLDTSLSFLARADSYFHRQVFLFPANSRIEGFCDLEHTRPG